MTNLVAGKVGWNLAESLARDGGVLIASDTNQASTQEVPREVDARLVPPGEISGRTTERRYSFDMLLVQAHTCQREP